jgi:hypothetical protein
MYPSYNADSRIELFCRGRFDGWTCEGYEAYADAIDDNGDDALYERVEPDDAVREEIAARVLSKLLKTTPRKPRSRQIRLSPDEDTPAIAASRRPGPAARS